jgi:DNA mismatch repair protein MutL
MSDVIKLLPDTVANQIAAGEVIQRPSSVIKELVENAVDAGATKVQIIVVEAGKDCIQVVDNGKGMSDTDTRLAFERHATSKINDASDLFALHTKGFRGEALPSIAAVAQVELKTKQKDAEIGTSLIIEGGVVREQTPVTCPVGANFIVKNLFYNIPARRKFLKSNQTELNNIFNEFERIALAHPEVEFEFYSGKNLLQSLPSGNFKQRILNLFGRKLESQLIPIKVETDIVKISGFVGSPQSAKKKGVHQFFFVNNRYMRHPYFNKAVQGAYERLIPDGQQVSYFINLTVEPSQIDVNIHPSKTEIKFQEENAIWPIMLAAVREALGKYDAIPTIDFDTAGCPDIPTFTGDFSKIQLPEIKINPDFNPFEASSQSSVRSGGKMSTVSSHKRSGTEGWQGAYEALFSGADLPEVEASVPSPMLYDNLPVEEKLVWNKEDAKYIQYLGRFIVTNSPSGLLLIDQQRAHIRVLYEDFMKRLEDRKGLSQGLLFPQILQLSLSDSKTLETIQEELQYVGFDLSPLGGGSYSVLGIPAGTEGLDHIQVLQDMVEDAQNGQVSVREQIGHLISLGLSQRAAIPVGQYLSDAEMEDLVHRLYQTSNPNYTPDGRVVISTLDVNTIEKMFGI